MDDKAPGLLSGVVPHEKHTSIYNDCDDFILSLKEENGFYKTVVVSTIDMHTYFPQMLVCEPGSKFKYVMQWVDQVSYYSNVSAKFPVELFRHTYESMTACINVRVIGLSCENLNTWQVFQSNYMLSDPSM